MGLTKHVARILFTAYFLCVTWFAFKQRMTGSKQVSAQYKSVQEAMEKRFNRKFLTHDHKQVDAHSLGMVTVASSTLLASSAFTALGYTSFALPLAMLQAGKIAFVDMPWKHTSAKELLGGVSAWALDLALLGFALIFFSGKAKAVSVSTKSSKPKDKTKKKDPLQDFAKKSDSKPKKSKDEAEKAVKKVKTVKK